MWLSLFNDVCDTWPSAIQGPVWYIIQLSIYIHHPCFHQNRLFMHVIAIWCHMSSHFMFRLYIGKNTTSWKFKIILTDWCIAKLMCHISSAILRSPESEALGQEISSLWQCQTVTHWHPWRLHSGPDTVPGPAVWELGPANLWVHYHHQQWKNRSAHPHALDLTFYKTIKHRQYLVGLLICDELRIKMSTLSFLEPLIL